VDDYDGGKNEEAGGSGMGHVVTATCSGKCQAWMPIDYINRFLKEAYPNHAYLVKHKLKDYDMRKNLMISGSVTRGVELDEDTGGSDTMPIPGEDVVMTVYDGRPHPKGTV
jgi:hypothetical protein